MGYIYNDKEAHKVEAFSGNHQLTNLPRNKMAAFLQTIFQMYFREEKLYILVQNSLKFISNGPRDNNAALVKIMDWRRIGDKPSSEPMLTWLTDAYMRH